MTSTGAREGVDPALRTRSGGPKKWNGRGEFGVLLSFSEDVIDRVYDADTDTWRALRGVDDAHAHAAMLRSHHPGTEFEIVRLEAGVWRDYLGRTVQQVIRARWGQES